MHVSKLIIFVLALSSNFILAQPDTTKTKEYLKALEALQKKDTTSAITLFNESIRQNDDELSSFELAKIYSADSRFQNFPKAYIYIKKAIGENEKNIEYKLLKAFLMEEIFYYDPLCKTYRNDAISLYEDIVKENINCESAWFNLGRLNKEDYLKYMNSEYFSDLEDRTAGEPSPEYIYSPIVKFKKGLRGSTLRGETYDKFRATLPKAVLKYTRVASEMFSKAEEAFLKSVELIHSEKSFSELIELYILSKNYYKGLDLLKKFVNPNIEPSKYYLINGMTNYLTGNVELSEKEYKKAFELMTKEEREIYTNNSFKKLLKPEIADSLSTKDKEFVENYFNKYMQDHDPLILTSHNERLLEHFTRVTYSNLMFSAKRLNLTGWNTDRGEVVIRYGIPDQVRRMRASVFVSASRIARELTETETFYYPDKNFSFYDITRRGRYVFNDPGSDGIRVSQSRESTVDSIIVYRENRPEEYVPKLQGPMFNTPFAIYQFPSKSLSRTDIYISYLINPKDSSTQKKLFDNGYTTGIFLFDKNHNKTTEKVSDFPQLYSTTKLTINSLMLSSVPREGNIAFEILRKKDNSAFTYHDLFKVKKFPEKDLTISDLILCFDAGHSEYPSYMKRKDTYILPNPSNFFTQQMQMFIYYETNNLSLNTNNTTNFEQKITIQKKEEGGVINSLLSVVGLDREGKKISLTSKYQTQEKDPQMYLQLDMSKYEPGEYVITVTIKDIVTGKEVSSNTEINWK